MGDVSVASLPWDVCRGCLRVSEDCTCDTVQCLWCLNQSSEGECDNCDGSGKMRPERVSVIPDEEALMIREYLRESPELLHTEYKEESSTPLEGLCYPAAEAYYHVMDCELDVYCLSWSDVDPEADGTHWYLRDSDSGEFIDLSLPAGQVEELPPFEAGRRRGFMTGDSPSKRTAQVLSSLGFK